MKKRKIKDSELMSLVETYNEQKSKFMSSVSKLLQKRMNELFKTAPMIAKIGWVQYTPYFNDGDACVFGVERPHFFLELTLVEDLMKKYATPETQDVWTEFAESAAGEDRDIYEWETGNTYEFKDLVASVPELKETYSKFQDFESEFASIPDEVFLDAFGDHVTVVVDADKITINEYQHD